MKFLDIEKLRKILSEIKNKKFIIDKNSCSYFLKILFKKIIKYSNLSDPIYFLKLSKVKQEIENIKKAHIYDGVALLNIYFGLKKIL